MKNLYVVAWHISNDGGDFADRELKLKMEIFKSGPAWSGSLKLVILESEESANVLLRKYTPFTKDYDLIFVSELKGDMAYYAGWLVDEEGLAGVLASSEFRR